MEKLPPEILIQIFNHLSVFDLNNLSKINFRFHQIIQSTPSLKFYNIKFDKKGKSECKKTHRIGQLEVINYIPRSHQNILTMFGENITMINFSKSDISYPKIASILTLCPNAKQVKFEHVSLWPEVVKQLPKLSNLLVELIESSICLLDIFTNSKLVALRLLHSTQEECIGVRGFLNNQKTLKSLYLNGPKTLKIFISMGNSFHENYVPLPMKLTYVVLKDIVWENNFHELFWPQCESIKILELVDIKPHASFVIEALETVINASQNLEELKVENLILQFVENSNIKKLTMKNVNALDDWYKNIENLKHFIVSNQQPYESDFDLSKNSNLEILEIFSSPLIQTALIIPSVKKLKIDNLTRLCSDENEKFITRNNKVEELEIINCGELTEEILNEVGDKMNYLRILKVRGGKCSLDVRNNVRRKCRNLKEVNFVNVELLG